MRFIWQCSPSEMRPGGMKLRPVLALTGPIGNVPEVIVAYISSAIPTNALPSDLLLDPNNPRHQSSNLKVISVLRLHKLATIHRSSLTRRLGKLPAELVPEVRARLATLLQYR